MELRERLADMLRQYFNWSPEACFDARASALTLADAILQIPEIKEALTFTGKFRDSGYNVSDPSGGATLG